MRGILRILVGCLMTVRLAAALPVFEPFNYAAGTVLDGVSPATGQGWSRLAGGGTPQSTVAAGNLSGSGWPASSGRLAGMAPAGVVGGSRLW